MTRPVMVAHRLQLRCFGIQTKTTRRQRCPQQTKSQPPFIKEVQNRGEEAMDYARGQIDETKERARELGEEALSQLKEVPKLIRKHPVEAVLLGFGAGLVTAFLVRRSLRH